MSEKTKEVIREVSKEPSTNESSKESSKEPSKDVSKDPSPEIQKQMKRTLTPEERNAIKCYTRRMFLTLPLFMAFISSFAYLVINDKVSFNGPFTAQDLPDFSSRLKFLLRYQIINLIWLLFSMYYVISKRVGSAASVLVVEYDHLTNLAQRHLSNTIEQYLMSIISQLILLTYLDAFSIIRYIPAINVLFFIGRLLFWIGYPQNRAFGFLINHTVLLATVGYNLYKFLQLFKVL